MRLGTNPGKETFAQVRDERDELKGQVQNQRELVVDNECLRLRVADLERQVRVWRKGGAAPGGVLKCSVCRQIKPVEAFWKNRSRSRGYRSYCKACDKQRYPRRQLGGLTLPTICA